MDIFSELDKRKEKEEYIISFNKNITLCRKILLYIFLSIGLLFVILGSLLAFVDKILLIIFVPIGVFFIILSFILFFSLKKINGEKAYERYQKRIKDGRMPINFYDMNHRIISLEHELERLKEEIEYLKKK